MKPYLFIILVLLSELAISQNTKSVAEKVTEAELIFEGRVVAQKSFWNNDSSTILTSNLLVPLKLFKGTYQDTIEILTLGGQVNGRFVQAQNTFQLEPKSDYFLFLKQKDATFFKAGRPSYFPINVNYGVVIISPNRGSGLEAEQYRKRNLSNMDSAVYKPVAAIVGSDYKVFAKNHLEEMIDNDVRKHQILDSIFYQRNVVEAKHGLVYHFNRPTYTQVKANDTHFKSMCQFAIQAQSLQLESYKNKAEKLISASVYLNYDTTIIGFNLVARKLFNAEVGKTFAERGYKILVADTARSIIKITVFSLLADSGNLFMFTRDYSDLVECNVVANDKKTDFEKLKLTFNFSCMANKTEFLDPNLGIVKPFQSIGPLTGIEIVRFSGSMK